MGVILGTAAYMSPEQAKGKAVDQRADIWAFGVVLFEMLTGRQAFTGETASEVMASVHEGRAGLDRAAGESAGADPAAAPPLSGEGSEEAAELDERRRASS